MGVMVMVLAVAWLMGMVVLLRVPTVTFLASSPQSFFPTDTLQDEKASVRRNAVPALEALLGFSPAFSGVAVEGVRGGATAEHAAELLLLQERCNDVSLSTRKVRLYGLGFHRKIIDAS